MTYVKVETLKEEAGKKTVIAHLLTSVIIICE
jgi:hypothetical protein